MTTDVARAPTGIEGFDFLSRGGIPEGRTTLLAGAAGTGKTVFSLSCVRHGIEELGESAVYVPLEESPADLRRTAASFGWDLAAYEDAGDLRFVDAVPPSNEQPVITGSFDLGALISRIEHAIEQVGAKRVVIDAVSTLFSYLPDPARIRWEIFRLRRVLQERGVTSIITAERDRESPLLTRNGVEAYVTDNVVVLRNRHDGRQRSRTVAIAKFRAATHQQGETPFTIRSDEGIVVTPLSAMTLEQPTSTQRISTGVDELDELTGGGLYQASAVLVSGPTGAGKTLTACHFLAGMASDERGLLFAFEESRSQLLRDADGWGLPLRGFVDDGQVLVHSDYPERFSLESHLIRIKQHVDDFQPTRVALDSLTALQRIGTVRGFREFVLGLLSYLKERGITLLMTATASSAKETESLTQSHVSSVSDGIILLRYVEAPGTIERAMSILKLRGTEHDRSIRSFRITGAGLEIGEPLDVPANMLGDGIVAFGGRIE